MVTEYSFPKIFSINLWIYLILLQNLISVISVESGYVISRTKHPDVLLLMYIFFFFFLFLVDSIRIPSSMSKVNNLCDNFFETDTIEDNNYSMLVSSLNLFLSLYLYRILLLKILLLHSAILSIVLLRNRLNKLFWSNT